MLSEEKIKFNYSVFISKLEKYNCLTEKLKQDDEFNNKLMNASAFVNEDSGGAYAGSLIEHANRVAVIAYKINESLAKEVQISPDSIVRVSYLFGISKAIMLEANTVEYEIKRGKLYRFANNLPAIKGSELSIYLCNKYDIELTQEEFEAILIIDKDCDIQSKIFSSVLTNIIKSANDLAISEKKAKYKNNIVKK